MSSESSDRSGGGSSSIARGGGDGSSSGRGGIARGGGDGSNGGSSNGCRGTQHNPIMAAADPEHEDRRRRSRDASTCGSWCGSGSSKCGDDSGDSSRSGCGANSSGDGSDISARDGGTSGDKTTSNDADE